MLRSPKQELRAYSITSYLQVMFMKLRGIWIVLHFLRTSEVAQLVTRMFLGDRPGGRKHCGKNIQATICTSKSNYLDAILGF